jgi:hypothetical protein
MRIDEEVSELVATEVARPVDRGKNSARWLAAVLATLVMLAGLKYLKYFPYVDTDSPHYQAMADGKSEMKPFAFRVLDPAIARLFSDMTGDSTDAGFLVVGFASGWILVYGVLTPVLERSQDSWLALVLILTPFWLRNFGNYFLPDPLHAALMMVYLVLLRRRLWGWASVLLAVMFLARESTLLVALIVVPTLWWLVSRRSALMQVGGALVGMAASKFAARHALANQHNINDTLYMIGKIPWNLSRNVFGVTLWTNTMPLFQPIRVWNVPRWMHTGNIHQMGYSAFDSIYPIVTSERLLTSFGLGVCVVVCLMWRTPLRRLLPREEPYLCIAAIYGAITFLLAPMLGASLPRLCDYGWPLFLVYLPAVIPRVWRNWPVRTVVILLGLHLIAAWIEVIRFWIFHFDVRVAFTILIAVNFVAGGLMMRMMSASRRSAA